MCCAGRCRTSDDREVWVIAVVLIVAIAVPALVLSQLRRRGQRREAVAAGALTAVDDGLDPSDTADLDARFSAVEAEQAEERNRRLARDLQPLIDRRIPARSIERAPGVGAARIRFADGTAVFVRGVASGDVGVLAALMHRRAVPPEACAATADGTRLTFGWPGRRQRVSVVVTGLDQPD
jgi:hypothetical protein